ncbi:hypothetical protein F5884DRAFT_753268 [Xylogone sp. PMI_703]|nr:hypothetical protein F5884DRAFT_753268 [Xylogone sp. PMI_703]
MDPGTALSVISLGIQVAHGIQGYFKLWKDCERDVLDLQNSLARTIRIFEHLKVTLQRVDLEQTLVSTILLNIKSCEEKVGSLNLILKKFKIEGTPGDIFERLKSKSHRALYPFRASTILRISEIIEDIKDDLHLTLEILSIPDAYNTSKRHKRAFETESIGLFAYLSRARTNMQQCYNETKFMNGLTHPKILYLTCLHWRDAIQRLENGFSRVKSLRPRSVIPPVGCGFTETLAAEKQYCGMYMTYHYLLVPHSSHISHSSAIINELQTLAKPTNARESRPNLIYFYFSFDHASGQDISTVVRSINWQMCADRDTPSELRALFSKIYPARPSSSDLHGVLRAMLKRYGGRPENLPGFYHDSGQTAETFFVFDGLDEIPYGLYREAILGLLNEISTISTSDKIHILVTSRPEKDISSYLLSSQGWLRYSMSRQKVQSDIALYVCDQISSHPKLNKLPADIKSRIQQRLIQGSNGMFRWVALQIQDLRRLRIVRPYDVLRILDMLPPDLDTTYEGILERLDPRLYDEAFTALEWLTFARRPLFLEQLAEASIIEPESEVIIDPDRRIEPSDIAELLIGLVVVEPEIDEKSVFPLRTHVVSLAHFSVQEYLLSRSRKTPAAECWFLEATIAHSNTTMSCIAYVRYCHTAHQSDLSQPPVLRSYCLNRWAQHAALSTRNKDDDIWYAVRDMLSNPEISMYWMRHAQVFWVAKFLTRSYIQSSSFRRSPYANVSLLQGPELLQYYSLHHCVVHRLHRLVRILLQRSDPPLSLHQYESALEAAVVLEDLNMIEILLEHGSDFGRSLSLALTQTSEKIAFELISRGCEAQGEDLILAARWSTPDLMRRIIHSGVQFHLNSAVLALNSSLFGKKGVTEALLEVLSSRNPLSFEKPRGEATVYQDLLINACRTGLPYTVDLLIRHEGSFRTSISDYNKALHLAVSCGHPAVIKVLLNGQAKPKITYKTFSNAVRCTIWKRDYTAFQPLLWHIPVGSNVPSFMLRRAIALNKERLALKLLDNCAGFNRNGIWVDDIFLQHHYFNRIPLSGGSRQPWWISSSAKL